VDLATRSDLTQAKARLMTSVPETPLSDEATSRIIEMAWEDRTPFEAIRASFGVSEPQVIKLMRASLKRSSFELWRKRVSGRRTKHASRSDPDVLRHRANHRW
jgi:uncharacterized protein (TIGR03643 family)